MSSQIRNKNHPTVEISLLYDFMILFFISIIHSKPKVFLSLFSRHRKASSRMAAWLGTHSFPSPAMAPRRPDCWAIVAGRRTASIGWWNWRRFGLQRFKIFGLLDNCDITICCAIQLFGSTYLALDRGRDRWQRPWSPPCWSKRQTSLVAKTCDRRVSRIFQLI